MKLQKSCISRQSLLGMVVGLGSLLLFIVGLSGIITPVQKAEANTFDLIKTASNPAIYVNLPIGRYHIRDADTWNRWGFDPNSIRIISDAAMAAIPQGPDITRALRPFNDPTVYVIENGQTRAVTSAQAFTLAGYQWTDISEVEKVVIDQLPKGPVLDAKVVRSPSDGAIYYLWGGQKHHIVSQDVWNNWGFKSYLDSPLVNNIPTGSDLTRLVRPTGSSTVFVIDNGHRRPLPSPDALVLNNFSWSDVVDADPDLIASLPLGDIFYAPTTVKIPGGDATYYLDQGIRHRIIDTDTWNNWGFSRFGSTITAAAANYPEGNPVTRLVRTEDGTVWRIKDGYRRAITSIGVFNGYGFSWNDVTNLPIVSLWPVPDGGVLDYTTDNLNGFQIPATAGRTGLEQHLWTTAGENTEADHYQITGVPATGTFLDCVVRGCIRNGVAGTGAFGRLDPTIEKWYITMRWPYCTWKETTGVDSFGKPATICSSDDFNSKAKNQLFGMKVIVSNPRTGKRVVAAVGESGPAIWVTREQGVVAGLSPEGVDYLQANYNTNGDQLTFGWAVDQTLPLGPLAQ